MKPKLTFLKDSSGNIRIGLLGFGHDLLILYIHKGKVIRPSDSYYVWDLTLKSLVNMMSPNYYHSIRREFLVTTYYFLFKKKILAQVDKLLVKEIL